MYKINVLQKKNPHITRNCQYHLSAAASDSFLGQKWQLVVSPTMASVVHVVFAR